jgi:phosphoglycerate dehydrogenase-like enzyme
MLQVLSTMAFDESWLAAVRAQTGARLVQVSAIAVDDVPAELLASAEVMYTGNVLPSPAQAPRLRWVQLDTSGADHVRGTALWDSEVTLTSLGGVSPRPMAEYVLAMVLAFAHRLPRAAREQRRREWPDDAGRWSLYHPAHVPGSRMVIVGYGALGRGIARMARGLGIDVTGVRGGSGRRYAEEVDGVEVVTADRLDEALAAADWLVLCTPGTPRTMGLIGPRELAAVKPGAHLINVSRGGVVDEEALLAALDDGRLAGAALDVFATEPLPPSSALWDHPAVLVTPHVSGLASDYAAAVRDLFVDNLRRYVAGRPLRNVIDRHLGY